MRFSSIELSPEKGCTVHGAVFVTQKTHFVSCLLIRVHTRAIFTTLLGCLPNSRRLRAHNVAKRPSSTSGGTGRDSIFLTVCAMHWCTKRVGKLHGQFTFVRTRRSFTPLSFNKTEASSTTLFTNQLTLSLSKHKNV